MDKRCPSSCQSRMTKSKTKFEQRHGGEKVEVIMEDLRLTVEDLRLQ